MVVYILYSQRAKNGQFHAPEGVALMMTITCMFLNVAIAT